MDAHSHAICLRQIVIWKRKETLPLCIEHALNAATLSINQIQFNHGISQEWIAVDGLRGVLLDDRLNIAGQKIPDIGQQYAVGKFDDNNPSTQTIVLMCDAVVQGLADYPWVVLSNFLREQCPTRQGAHSEVADALQKAVPCKQERRPNVLVI